MKFQPTAQELTVGIVHNEGPYNLDSAELAVPGSAWGVNHLKALRVILLDGLPLSRILPAEYILSGSHQGEFAVFHELLKHLSYHYKCIVV